jgi:hypothetical protein
LNFNGVLGTHDVTWRDGNNFRIFISILVFHGLPAKHEEGDGHGLGSCQEYQCPGKQAKRRRRGKGIRRRDQRAKGGRRKKKKKERGKEGKREEGGQRAREGKRSGGERGCPTTNWGKPATKFRSVWLWKEEAEGRAREPKEGYKGGDKVEIRERQGRKCKLSLSN